MLRLYRAGLCSAVFLVVSLSCASEPRRSTLRDVSQPGVVVPADKRLAIFTVLDERMPAADFVTIADTFSVRLRERHPQIIDDAEFMKLVPPRKFRALKLALLDETLSEKKARTSLAANPIPGVEYVLVLKIERLNIREYLEPKNKDKKDSDLRNCSDHILELKFYLYNQASRQIEASGGSANHSELCGKKPNSLFSFSIGDAGNRKPDDTSPITEWDGDYPKAAPLGPIVDPIALDIRGLLFP